MTNRTVKPAQGKRGYLIWTGEHYCLRLYEADGFKDYRLLHSDLYVDILDEEAELYEYEDGRCYLDHSRQTLGDTDA